MVLKRLGVLSSKTSWSLARKAREDRATQTNDQLGNRKPRSRTSTVKCIPFPRSSIESTSALEQNATLHNMVHDVPDLELEEYVWLSL